MAVRSELLRSRARDGAAPEPNSSSRNGSPEGVRDPTRLDSPLRAARPVPFERLVLHESESSDGGFGSDDDGEEVQTVARTEANTPASLLAARLGFLHGGMAAYLGPTSLLELRRVPRALQDAPVERRWALSSFVRRVSESPESPGPVLGLATLGASHFSPLCEKNHAGALCLTSLPNAKSDTLAAIPAIVAAHAALNPTGLDLLDLASLCLGDDDLPAVHAALADCCARPRVLDLGCNDVRFATSSSGTWFDRIRSLPGLEFLVFTFCEDSAYTHLISSWAACPDKAHVILCETPSVLRKAVEREGGVPYYQLQDFRDAHARFFKLVGLSNEA